MCGGHTHIHPHIHLQPHFLQSVCVCVGQPPLCQVFAEGSHDTQDARAAEQGVCFKSPHVSWDPAQRPELLSIIPFQPLVLCINKLQPLYANVI